MLVERDPIALTIGGYAAVVSTAVFAWTVYNNKKEKSEDKSNITLYAKILVTSEPFSGQRVTQDSYLLEDFYPNSATSRNWMIEIHFANSGRRPATITGWAAVRKGRFGYPPEEVFRKPITLQESETDHFILHNFDAFRHNTIGFVIKDSHGKSWPLPPDQLKRIQKLMLDHKF